MMRAEIDEIKAALDAKQEAVESLDLEIKKYGSQSTKQKKTISQHI